MADRREYGKSNKAVSNTAENVEHTGLSESSARAAQASQRSLPPMRGPRDATPSTLSPLSPHERSSHPGAKVAIPRLRRDTDDPSGPQSSASPDNKHRVRHACEPCRQRKTKCSGERPMCKHCEDFKIICVYADGKRDRTKREYNMMAARVGEYEEFLKELIRGDRVCEEDQLLIQRVLGKGNQDIMPGREGSAPQGTSQDENTLDEQETPKLGTEHQATGRAGSTGALDRVTEDFNRSATSRATGYLGKNSDVTWIGSLRRQTDVSSENEDKDAKPQFDFGSGLDQLYNYESKGAKGDHFLSDYTYHCDDAPFLAHENVQSYQLPPKATADLLLASYLECVHPAFPILGKTTFLKQYQAFYENQHLNTGPRWLAVLNLVFALSARYSRLVRTKWRSLTDEPNIYFSRAWLLALDANVFWAHAELQRIQVTGLMSFYFMATHQLNRAFAMSGIAIRQALTLGLNLRNEDRNLVDSSKEIRYRVWWALASTERTLSVMTGRPASFTGAHCSAPLPLPLEEEMFMSVSGPYDSTAIRQLRRLSSTDDESSTNVSESTPSSLSTRAIPWSPRDSPMRGGSPTAMDIKSIDPNNGLFFLYVTKIKNLDDEILNHLYRPPIISQSWASVQDAMLRFTKKLRKWRSTLPLVFEFTRNQRDQVYVHQRMHLGFSYYSTMIIINRPCLCRVDEKVPNESKRAREIDRASAASCVSAARSLLDMLPDEPNAVGMYQVSPWWNMVHHLMQAATVLMLEISFQAAHCPDSANEIFMTAQKAVAWLQSMSVDDISAARAWRLSIDVLRKIAPRVGERVDDRLMRPMQRSEDTLMQDITVPASMFNVPDHSSAFTSSADLPLPPGGTDFADSRAYSAWEPLMFTSYDNYLLGNNPLVTQAPSEQYQWN